MQYVRAAVLAGCSLLTGCVTIVTNPQQPVTPPPLELTVTLIDHRSGPGTPIVSPSYTTQVFTDPGPPTPPTPQKTLCGRLVKVIELEPFDVTPYQSPDAMLNLIEALLKRTQQIDTWLEGVRIDGTCEEE